MILEKDNKVDTKVAKVSSEITFMEVQLELKRMSEKKVKSLNNQFFNFRLVVLGILSIFYISLFCFLIYKFFISGSNGPIDLISYILFGVTIFSSFVMIYSFWKVKK